MAVVVKRLRLFPPVSTVVSSLFVRFPWPDFFRTFPFTFLRACFPFWAPSCSPLPTSGQGSPPLRRWVLNPEFLPFFCCRLGMGARMVLAVSFLFRLSSGVDVTCRHPARQCRSLLSEAGWLPSLPPLSPVCGLSDSLGPAPVRPALSTP